MVPSRRQYLDLKAGQPGALLLYRMGDFYEAFDDDARILARDAHVTLTSRGLGRSGRVPMAGIPHHALNHYLARLLAAGHTVALAEQVGEVGRGLVERAVTRVLTPGTVAEPALLAERENRYLAAVHPLGDRLGLAWVDVSTGEFAVTELVGADAAARLGEEIARLGPAECLVPAVADGDGPDLTLPGHRTRLERWHFEPGRAADALCRRFGTRSLAPYGCADLPAATGAAGAVLAYLERTNPALLPLLTGLRTETGGDRVGLDTATRRNLELTRSLGTGGSRGSLLGVLDETRTAMGARALRRLLGRPLRDLPELRRRQAVVAALVARPATRAALATSLAGVGDLERLTGRVAQGLAGARDFLALGAALRAVPTVIGHLRADDLAVAHTGAHAVADPALASAAAALDPCADVLTLLETAVEAGEGTARICDGFCAELDAALAGTHETRRWLAGLERHERERTGIRSLRVRHNKVFGYYIEVTRPNLPQVPNDYVRKQTVAIGERYVTAPLKDAEACLLAADGEVAALERAALARLGADVTAAAARLQATATQLAHLDALLALAEVAARHGWVAPTLDEGDTLEIVGGRHPVVEATLGGEPFIPNGCRLGGDGAPRVVVVTGPNMGGKSTYLRQVALIVLLAQVGSFVPAAAARVGLVDRIFTRVGAQDDLAGGASTFMVEMVETAAILHQATKRSLLVLDEVGRGTATDDGLAIARAVLEDIHGRLGARALFATHYLELTALAGDLPGLANAHVAALETGDRVVFLYAVRPGPADRAYGIQVARLAGLPPWVADRAAALLADRAASAAAQNATCPTVGAAPPPVPTGTNKPGGLAATGHRENPADAGRAETAVDVLVSEHPAPPYQLALDGFPSPSAAEQRLARDLRDLDLATITPLDALNWLARQKAHLGNLGG